MIVVAHDGVGQQVDSKDLRQPGQSILQPLTSVVEIRAGQAILAAEEGTSNATGGAVIVARMVQADLLAPGNCHRCLVNEPMRTIQDESDPGFTILF